MQDIDLESYAIEIGLILRELGIPTTYGTDRQLPLMREASQLITAGEDIYGRPQQLQPATVQAWNELRQLAQADGIVLQLVSGFRSVQYQRGIIERKLARGLHIQEILRSSAAPGFSEHHTGRALDLTTPGATPLTEEFDSTVAFEWLKTNAPRLGFRLSFPRHNPHGIVYEPWHWFDARS